MATGVSIRVVQAADRHDGKTDLDDTAGRNQELCTAEQAESSTKDG